jgi:uncharacterized protein with von Willebrand factor type A (vWA) domain
LENNGNSRSYVSEFANPSSIKIGRTGKEETHAINPPSAFIREKSNFTNPVTIRNKPAI